MLEKLQKWYEDKNKKHKRQHDLKRDRKRIRDMGKRIIRGIEADHRKEMAAREKAKKERMKSERENRIRQHKSRTGK